MLRNARLERGSALLTAMITVFVIAGLIASLFTLVISASDESTLRISRGRLAVAADAGAQRTVAQLYGDTVTLPDRLTLTRVKPGLQYTSTEEGDGTYMVNVASLRSVIPVSGKTYDLLEITSIATDRLSGMRHGVQTVVDAQFARSQDNINPFPAAFTALKGLTSGSNKWLIDGSNRKRSTLEPGVGVTLHDDVKIEMNVRDIPSSAGWKSDFYVQAGNNAPVLVVAGVNSANHPAPVLTKYTFLKGQKLNFFIKVHSDKNVAGISEYNHYAFPRPDYIDPVTGDDPLHAFTGWNQPYTKWWGYSDPVYYDSRPYCRIEQISDSQYKLFFEDMPGAISDWDNGTAGDLYHKADQNVTVTLVPADLPPGQASDPWAMLPGVPAIAYDGSYTDFNLPDDTSHLIYMNDDEVMQTGALAHTTDTVPVTDFRDEFVNNQHVDSSIPGTTFANKDFGTATDPQVVHITGDTKLTGNSKGYGILIVDGNLTITGQHSFEGLIIATGDVTIKGGNNGDARLMGAIMTAGKVTMAGNGDVLYNWDALYKALQAAGDPNEIIRKLTDIAKPKEITDVDTKVWRELDDGQVGRYLEAHDLNQ